MRMRRLGLALAGCLVSSCMPEPRPLSFKEAVTPVIVGDSPSVAAELEAKCKAIGTFQGAPTVHDQSLGTGFRVAAGETLPCIGQIATLDDLRRCAGERQADAVQIVGSTTETDRIDPLKARKILDAMEARAWEATDRIADVGYRLELDEQAQQVLRERTVALDLRLWRCPASRATPVKGELVWRREGSFMNLVQDGQMVGNNGDFDKLPDLVAAHPAALDFAKQAVAEQRWGHVKMYTGVSLSVLALGGLGVGIVGLYKNNYRLGLIGGGSGVVLMSVSIPLMISGGNTLLRGQTTGMNAVDAWNDEYLHGRHGPMTP